MEQHHRLQYAIEHVTGKSVFIVERTEWERIVDESGEPIRLANVPSPISSLVTMAAYVTAAGSGIYNPSPGIDVVRDDPADAPYIYNIDHYTVFERFASSPYYPKALHVSRIEETEELNDYIQSHVFVVGPYRTDIHWVEEIPDQIRSAKLKG